MEFYRTDPNSSEIHVGFEFRILDFKSTACGKEKTALEEAVLPKMKNIFRIPMKDDTCARTPNSVS